MPLGGASGKDGTGQSRTALPAVQTETEATASNTEVGHTHQLTGTHSPGKNLPLHVPQLSQSFRVLLSFHDHMYKFH